jgi:ParB family chromosome partitioning protein
MGGVISVSPFRCRMWEMHDRLEGHISAETCRSEIESFRKHGQLVPALGRPLKNSLDFEVELIYGARRLFVARHLNVPLLIDLREMTDIEAIVAMDIENRQRTDISPYERGLSFAQWLRAGYFGSQDDIARALQISASQVSRLLRLARLPAVILNAFESPTHICEGWGRDFMDALDDPERRPLAIKAARALAQLDPRPPAREIHRRLMSSIHGRRRRSARDEVVRDGERPLFRIRWLRQSIALTMRLDDAPPSVLEEIRDAVANVLKRSMSRETGLLGTLQTLDHAPRLVARSASAPRVLTGLQSENVRGASGIQS